MLVCELAGARKTGSVSVAADTAYRGKRINGRSSTLPTTLANAASDERAVTHAMDVPRDLAANPGVEFRPGFEPGRARRILPRPDVDQHNGAARQGPLSVSAFRSRRC